MKFPRDDFDHRSQGSAWEHERKPDKPAGPIKKVKDLATKIAKGKK